MISIRSTRAYADFMQIYLDKNKHDTFEFYPDMYQV